MPQPGLDRAALLALLTQAADQLTGEWLVVGGAAAALWFRADRRTEDLDLVPFDDAPSARHQLLAFAESQGLAIEVVNSAADYFVKRIPDWRSEVEPLIRGRTAALWRPSPTLFLLLKLGRLTETDLEDCLALLAHAAAVQASVDRPRARTALAALSPTHDPRLQARRVSLDRALATGR